MKIKIENKTSIEAEPKFPVLMMHKDSTFVVAFTAMRTGFVVWSNGKPQSWYFGYWSDCWQHCTDMSMWKPFKGSVTLEND